MKIQEFSDDTLRAYLAANLPDPESAAIELQLAHSPELEKRLMALEPFAEEARLAFERVPTEDRLRKLVPNAPFQKASRWPLALTLAACLAGIVGFGLGNFTATEKPLEWREQIAVYQALYTPATIAALDPTATELDQQFSDGSAVIGRDVQPAMLEGLNGFDLKRAQILEADGQPIVQIVLAETDGEPLAFCIVHLGTGASPSNPEFERLAGLPTVHWVDGDYGYMLVGRVDADNMRSTANILHARF